MRVESADVVWEWVELCLVPADADSRPSPTGMGMDYCQLGMCPSLDRDLRRGRSRLSHYHGAGPRSPEVMWGLGNTVGGRSWSIQVVTVSVCGKK